MIANIRRQNEHSLRGMKRMHAELKEGKTAPQAEPIPSVENVAARVLKAMWCRLVHASYRADPVAAPWPPWRCTCDVCGRVWAEGD